MPTAVRSISTKANGLWHVGETVTMGILPHVWHLGGNKPEATGEKVSVVQGHVVMFHISAWVSQYLGGNPILREISAVRFRNYLRMSDSLVVTYHFEGLQSRRGYALGTFAFWALRASDSEPVIEPTRFKIYWTEEPRAGP